MSTNIEWTDETWNPITGCSHAGSAGCDYCYARRMANRLRGRFGYPQDEPFRVTWHEDKAKQPLTWKKSRRIFVCSMSDIAHQNVKYEWFRRIMDTITLCSAKQSQHIFQVLTKRPERLSEMLRIFYEECRVDDGYCKNLWIGVTAENQAAADERIPILLEIPAAVRFVSVEPMLGPVDLGRWLGCRRKCRSGHMFPRCYDITGELYSDCPQYQKPNIDWVICGGETGPGARPLNLHWAWDLQRQCEDAWMPFFFKGWGTGSERSGRVIDGLEWNQFPGHYKAEGDL